MTTQKNSLIVDIWRSFMAHPKWVIAWVIFILAPVNIASIAFLDMPSGLLVATLVWSGMGLMFIPMIVQRGFSKGASAAHIIPWTTLVFYLLLARPDVSGAYDQYLTVLLTTNTVSLLFDYTDTYRWLRGERAVARPTENGLTNTTASQ